MTNTRVFIEADYPGRRKTGGSFTATALRGSGFVCKLCPDMLALRQFVYGRAGASRSAALWFWQLAQIDPSRINLFAKLLTGHCTNACSRLRIIFFPKSSRYKWSSFVTKLVAPDSNVLLHDDAVSLVESWKRFSIQEMTVQLLDAALIAKERWQLSYWDDAIIEAARQSKCETLFSEDLNAGQNFGGVLVVNPFV